MSIAVFGIYKRVVIDEVLVACVIRRIDVDDINLSLMRIAEGSECFEVVTLNQNMVRSIRFIAQYCLVFYFTQNGQRVTQPFLYVFWFIFPHQSILLMLTQQPDEAATLVVGQAL